MKKDYYYYAVTIATYVVVGYTYTITVWATYQFIGINGIQLHIASAGLAALYVHYRRRKRGFEITRISPMGLGLLDKALKRPLEKHEESFGEGLELKSQK